MRFILKERSKWIIIRLRSKQKEAKWFIRKLCHTFKKTNWNNLNFLNTKRFLLRRKWLFSYKSDMTLITMHTYWNWVVFFERTYCHIRTCLWGIINIKTIAILEFHNAYNERPQTQPWRVKAFFYSLLRLNISLLRWNVNRITFVTFILCYKFLFYLLHFLQELVIWKSISEDDVIPIIWVINLETYKMWIESAFYRVNLF